MRDIPLFTTSNGVASLYFKKIPFTKEAFIHIRDSLTCENLLAECIDFCRMAGAEYIYAAGDEMLTKYPEACSILRYCVQCTDLPSTDAVALAVQPEQKDWWRQLYNQKMIHVPTASPLSTDEVGKLIDEGKAYIVYRDCVMLGIGVAYDGEIQAVASLIPGGGKDTVLALIGCLENETVFLRVASGNEKAIGLYRSLGFERTALEGTWYKIL